MDKLAFNWQKSLKLDSISNFLLEYGHISATLLFAGNYIENLVEVLLIC